MKTNRGFSLLELLIVVAIILIIATIAIPSMLRSRQTANESVAVANMRNLNSAQLSYSVSNGGVYGSITDLIDAGLIDSRYGSANYSGYRYSLSVAPGSQHYTAYGTAISPNTGRYDYYSVADFVIRYSVAVTRAPTAQSGFPVR